MAKLNEEGLTNISRTISYLLRHNPGSAGLKMSEKGEVSLESLADALNISVKTVREIVEKDSKGRYVIEGDLIWATQGHSIPVLARNERVTELGAVYHGTKRHYLDSIKKQGLIAGDRLHVHLSSDIATAITVAGRRRGDSVILRIDGNKLLADGYEVLRSSNGVLLTNYIPWEYVLDVTPVIDFEPKS
jgi:putative RNA 2'-phosphotransferase